MAARAAGLGDARQLPSGTQGTRKMGLELAWQREEERLGAGLAVLGAGLGGA
jgi:hypothetical protein